MDIEAVLCPICNKVISNLESHTKSCVSSLRSHSASLVCMKCKDKNNSIIALNCSHYYCIKCIGELFTTLLNRKLAKLQDGNASNFSINCCYDTTCNDGNNTNISLYNIMKIVYYYKINPFFSDYLLAARNYYFNTVYNMLNSDVSLTCKICLKKMCLSSISYSFYQSKLLVLIQTTQHKYSETFLDDLLNIILYTCPNCNNLICPYCGSRKHDIHGSQFCNHFQFLLFHFLFLCIADAFEIHRHSNNNHNADTAIGPAAPPSSKPKHHYGGQSGIDINTAQAIREKSIIQSQHDKSVNNLLNILYKLLSADPLLEFVFPLPLCGLFLFSPLSQVFHYFLNNVLTDMVKRLELYSSIISLLHLCKVLGLFFIFSEQETKQSEQNSDYIKAPPDILFYPVPSENIQIIHYLESLQKQISVSLSSASLFTKNMDQETIYIMAFQSGIMFLLNSDSFHFLRKTELENVIETPLQNKETFTDNKESKESDILTTRLEDIQFALVDLINTAPPHHYAKSAELSSSTAIIRFRRIRNELSTLSASLPPGIFLRVDSTYPHLLRCLIIGPEKTPYSHGFFFFDIFLPVDYPRVPPQVYFRTTGKGTFRFNANLYSNGKVCLSLLGTWSGPGWDPSNSTILQVLISIQAFIFCQYPFGNEPGWESVSNSADRPVVYHAALRHASLLYAIVWELIEPTHGFEEILRTYFYLNRNKILELCNEWQQEVVDAAKLHISSNTIYHDAVVKHSSIQETKSLLEKELNKLTKPLLKDK